MKDDSPSIEGFLVGIVANHYRLAKPTVIETPERSHELKGEAWIDRAGVLFLQVLS